MTPGRVISPIISAVRQIQLFDFSLLQSGSGPKTNNSESTGFTKKPSIARGARPASGSA